MKRNVPQGVILVGRSGILLHQWFTSGIGLTYRTGWTVHYDVENLTLLPPFSE